VKASFTASDAVKEAFITWANFATELGGIVG
jgi:hypothetical protein